MDVDNLDCDISYLDLMQEDSWLDEDVTSHWPGFMTREEWESIK